MQEGYFMANRYFRQFRNTLEPQVVDIFAQVSFGAAGAPTLSAANSKGIVSVTRTATGRYVFVFGTNVQSKDTYVKLLGVTATWDATANSGTAPAAPIVYLFANAISTIGTASVTVQCLDAAGVAADPASTEIVHIDFTLKNSTAF